jgi:hypothetical protein
MPAYVAYLHRGVAVYLFRSRRRDIELGRHEEVPDFGDTADEVVDLLLTSWRGTSERCPRTRITPASAAARRLPHCPQ